MLFSVEGRSGRAGEAEVVESTPGNGAVIAEDVMGVLMPEVAVFC